ncbi:N-acetylmuramoyl-L-alanine amidase [Carnobacterium pleistocenium]|uniref:N-acetylmuramoyl-L-alanine amidase n=1 Tax=Carnobacterium pleistocenium TaxID=181073 RepID=UPI00068A3934|nr:N-acetylmuramoyl-L-alanine amidase [Carnobacterium pleistocenium]
MVEIINKNVAGGIAGRRSGNPKGAVIHNDYGAMTPKDYVSWLAKRKANGQLNLGFAQYYINRDQIARIEDTFNKAWHTATNEGNGWFLGYEVTQSFGDVVTDAEFIENENMTFMQVAEDFHFYGLKPNTTTIRLHKQFSSTSCPHRSWELHGWSNSSVQNYFVKKVKEYMNLGKTVDQMIKATNKKVVIIAGSGHIETEGWKTMNNLTVGMTGKSRRLEAFNLIVKVDGKPVNVKGSLHIEDLGDVTNNTNLFGTMGISKRIESVKLNIDAAIEYRVHQQSSGWSKWTKNNQWCGIKGKRKRIEAIQFRVVQ